MSDKSKAPPEWATKLVERITSTLSTTRPEVSVSVLWGQEDGWAEVFISSGGADVGFGRMMFGDDDETGERDAFWSYGWQGHGGGQFNVDASDDALLVTAVQIAGICKAERSMRHD